MRVAFVVALLFAAVTSSWAAVVAPAAAPAAGTRLGCFMDSIKRDLEYLKHLGATMTIPLCIAHCKTNKFKFAGAQAHTWCLCGNQYSRHPDKAKRPDTECKMTCAGDRKTTCGGRWRNEIFTTGL